MDDYSAVNRLAKSFYDNSHEHQFYGDHEQLLALLSHLEVDDDGYIKDHFDIDAIRSHYMAHWKLGRLMLVVTEVAEAAEAVRKPGKMSDHVDGMKLFDEEMADAQIRIGDMCYRENVDLGESIRLKHEFNKGRPVKHGKAC